tara:strand:+ start:1835 stop:2047 length:213 start_codon:yes stop_codon:yes gene_type:complete
LRLNVKGWLRMTKTQQVLDLVEYLIDHMGIEELEHYVRENLTDYYKSEAGKDDFDTNYAEMQEIMGAEDD